MVCMQKWFKLDISNNCEQFKDMFWRGNNSRNSLSSALLSLQVLLYTFSVLVKQPSLTKLFPIP